MPGMVSRLACHPLNKKLVRHIELYLVDSLSFTSVVGQYISELSLEISLGGFDSIRVYLIKSCFVKDKSHTLSIDIKSSSSFSIAAWG